MPSSSKKQHNFMEAVAHSPSFAKKAGVPQSVGKDFSAADKGRKFSKGGEMATSKKMDMKKGSAMKGMMPPAPKAPAMAKRPKAPMGGMPMGGMGGMPAMAKGGGVESKGKTKGKMVRMAGGGRTC
jgi:hypothetical protein